jgi:hypothetical protein
MIQAFSRHNKGVILSSPPRLVILSAAKNPRISPLPLRLLVTLTYHPFERNEPKFPKTGLYGHNGVTSGLPVTLPEPATF